MARRKNDQLNSSSGLMNQSSQGMTGMSQAPHPDSGRQKGLSPKTTKDKTGQKFSQSGKSTAISS